MTCDEVRLQMDAYLSDSLEFEEHMDLEIHLAMCEECYHRFADMENVFRLVRNAFVHAPLPHDFAWHVCEELPEMAPHVPLIVGMLIEEHEENIAKGAELIDRLDRKLFPYPLCFLCI